MKQIKFQIGKNGITEGVIASLTNLLNTYKKVRLSFLKSSGRNKEKMKEMSAMLVEKIPHNLRSKIIGFTIILTRHK